jgi:hypothetical protein
VRTLNLRYGTDLIYATICDGQSLFSFSSAAEWVSRAWLMVLLAKQLSQFFNGIHVAEKYLAGF